DVEGVLGDHAAVGGAGHGGEEGGEAGVSPEDLDDEEALVGSGGGAQPVGQLDGAGHARAEPDAVVGAGDVVVHGLRDRDDADALGVQALGVAQGVVSADRDEDVDPEVLEVLEDGGGHVVDLVHVAVPEVGRDGGAGEPARVGPGGVEEGAAGPARTVHDVFGQDLDGVAVVRGGVGDQ